MVPVRTVMEALVFSDLVLYMDTPGRVETGAQNQGSLQTKKARVLNPMKNEFCLHWSMHVRMSCRNYPFSVDERPSSSLAMFSLM